MFTKSTSGESERGPSWLSRPALLGQRLVHEKTCPTGSGVCTSVSLALYQEILKRDNLSIALPGQGKRGSEREVHLLNVSAIIVFRFHFSYSDLHP